MTPREPKPERWDDLTALERRVEKQRKGQTVLSPDECRRAERDLMRAELGDNLDD